MSARVAGVRRARFRGFEVRVLGTRGNVKPIDRRHAFHSGILLGRDLMLDLGERGFLRWRPRWILITHLHPDHAFFVKRPNAGIARPTGIAGPVWLPETAGLKASTRVFAPEQFRLGEVEVVRPGKVLRLGPWRVTALPVIHSQRVRSLAYRVDRAGRSLLYTGDLLAMGEGYREALGNLDLVVTEGSFIRSGGLVRKDARTARRFGHAGLPEIVAFWSRFAPRILVAHLGSWFFRDPRGGAARVRALGDANGVVARAGWDGMHFSV